MKYDENKWRDLVFSLAEAGELSSGEVHVLLLVGRAADWRTGRNSRLGVATLVRKTGRRGVGRSSVQSALRKARALGLLEVEQRGGGRPPYDKPTVYRLALPDSLSYLLTEVSQLEGQEEGNSLTEVSQLGNSLTHSLTHSLTERARTLQTFHTHAPLRGGSPRLAATGDVWTCIKALVPNCNYETLQRLAESLDSLVRAADVTDPAALVKSKRVWPAAEVIDKGWPDEKIAANLAKVLEELVQRYHGPAGEACLHYGTPASICGCPGCCEESKPPPDWAVHDEARQGADR